MNCTNIQNFAGLVNCFTGMLNAIIPILIGFGLVLFLFGLVKYVTAGGEEKTLEEARNFIIFGIIALFVMVSVWGLVGFLTNTFFPNSFSIPQIR